MYIEATHSGGEHTLVLENTFEMQVAFNSVGYLLENENFREKEKLESLLGALSLYAADMNAFKISGQEVIMVLSGIYLMALKVYEPGSDELPFSTVVCMFTMYASYLENVESGGYRTLVADIDAYINQAQ